MKKPKFHLSEIELWAKKYNYELTISKKDIVLQGTGNFDGVKLVGKITKDFVRIKTIEVIRKLPTGTKEGWKYLREIKDNVYLTFSELKEYY